LADEKELETGDECNDDEAVDDKKVVEPYKLLLLPPTPPPTPPAKRPRPIRSMWLLSVHREYTVSARASAVTSRPARECETKNENENLSITTDNKTTTKKRNVIIEKGSRTGKKKKKKTTRKMRRRKKIQYTGS
jgi:hypothetical protein